VQTFTIGSDDLDWEFITAGTINLGSETNIAASGATITITVSGDANITGGAQNPVFYYEDDTIKDAGNNETGDFTVSVLDNAAPYILSYEYYDENSVNGQIDRVKITFTENTNFTYNAADWTVTANDLTGFALTGYESGTGTTTVVLTATANPGITGVNGGTEPTITYVNNSNRVVDGTGNATATGSEASTDVADKAAPYIVSGQYEDNNHDGQVDRVEFTMSENTTLWTTTSSSFQVVTSGVINLSVTGASTDGDGTTSIDLTDISADANKTGANGGAEPAISVDATALDWKDGQFATD
jgi:hypothetical protein